MKDEAMAQAAKIAADGVSVGLILGWAANVLPAIATLLTVVWMAIRIIETDTMRCVVERIRKWLGKGK